MREIKFKGYNEIHSKWLYGSLIKDSEYSFRIVVIDGSITYDWYDVNSESIGQFTGLKDKNGKDIYEGDILEFTEHPRYILESCKMEVCFDNDNSSFGYKSSKSMFPEIIFTFSQHDEVQIDVLNHSEVIGNIFSNPELIKQ